ncbi:MAG: DUF2723 domain-containing protein [Bacteroidales bacterium]|nr:DUF2723 domain-containing protein [Bacteroidales bacterium]
MKQYKLVNNILGWVIGIGASLVYILTAEATASWWDCGEFIATAMKLEVGHPPGAPTFQLLGRMFSMFGGPENAAHAINIMSAICSGLGIMFLFWTITMLSKKVLKMPNPSLNDWRTWGIFAAGIVGSLCYTFSDTYWFSAVEGEVYAMSSFFTAIVFWAILKWEEQADDDPRSLRWLVLICFLVGLAIGVHLLNLLTIPALVYVVYFKKKPETTWQGFFWSGVISVALLGVVLWGVIPGIVNVASAFDVFFVNKLHLPFNTGTIFFFLVLIALIVWGLWYTSKDKMNKPVANAGILGFVMLLIGYSTFFILIIRANTDTPLNENCPRDAVALRAYLGREQYGHTPFLKGQYYTAGNPIDAKKGYAKYERDSINGRDHYTAKAYAQDFVYRPEHSGVFPRMWSNDESRQHPLFYKYWTGNPPTNQKPTMSQNIKFLNRYQFGFMYWRYFMWTFAGRQNDVQGHYFNDDGTRDYLHGNWISGIKFIDEARLGPQGNMPDSMKDNKSRNTYFLLPLLLGLFGVVFQVKKDWKGALITFIMFFMTGLAIAIYLNMPPRQPRERDYAFVGSFYFYAVWVGMGVLALSEWISSLFKNKESAYKMVMPLVFVFAMTAVPVRMCAQNWDDHDRSQKTSARDFARNYLNSVNKNAVLISFGDNDTFPIWYAQEVEGVRTDVRILNYTLAGMHWYIEQLYDKFYESEPLPLTLPYSFYDLGEDQTFLLDNSAEFIEVQDLMKAMRDNPEQFIIYQQGQRFRYIPTLRFKITVNPQRLLELGVVDSLHAAYLTQNPEIKFQINGKGALYRHELMMLDLLGSNRFERDITIMSPGYIRSVFPLVGQYSVNEGMVFKLLPYPADQTYTERTFDFYLNGVDGKPLEWGNLNKDIYVDPISLNMGTVQRQSFTLLADEMLKKGDTVMARTYCDMGDKYFPKANFPRDKYCMHMIPLYKAVYGKDKAIEVWNDIYVGYEQKLTYLAQYLNSGRRERAQGVRGEFTEAVQILYSLAMYAREQIGEEDLANKVLVAIKPYESFLYTQQPQGQPSMPLSL